MAEEKTYWNGEPVNAVRGMAEVDGKSLRVVRVFYNGKSMDLDNSTGQAWAKVTIGHGSPRYGHRNVEVSPGSLVPDDWGPIVAEAFTRNKL